MKPPSAAFFGDDKGAVYALDAERGTLLWKTQVDSHPTGPHPGCATLVSRPPVRRRGLERARARPGIRRYGCCTFRGSVAALDIASGHVEWKTYLVGEEARP